MCGGEVEHHGKKIKQDPLTRQYQDSERKKDTNTSAREHGKYSASFTCTCKRMEEIQFKHTAEC